MDGLSQSKLASLLSLFTITAAPPLIFGVNYLARRVRSVVRESVVLNSKLLGAIQESTQGVAVVKAYTMESAIVSRVDGLIKSAENRANKITNISERTAPIAETLAGLTVASVIAWSCRRVIKHGLTAPEANRSPHRRLGMRNFYNLFSNLFRRKNEINAPAGNCALGHVRLRGGIQLLRDRDSACFLDAAQRRRSIAIIAGDNDSDQFAVPVLRQRPQKNRNHVGPSPGLRYRLKTEFSIKNVQIAL